MNEITIFDAKIKNFKAPLNDADIMKAVLAKTTPEIQTLKEMINKLKTEPNKD